MAAGRGHVRKRGAVWYVILDLARDPLDPHRRKQAWHRTEARTKAEAEKERTRLLRERDTGAAVAPSKLTVAEYADRWLAARHKLRPSTRQNYRGIIDRHIAPHLGALPLATLTADHIERWQARLRARSYKERTLLTFWTVLHAILATAVERNLIPRHPCIGVAAPGQDQDERRFWDEGQARRFLALIRGDTLEIPCLLAIGAGLRRGEVLALPWQDVDLAKALVAVRQAQIEIAGTGIEIARPKTAKGRRVNSMPPFLVAALAAHRERQAATRAEWGERWAGGELVFTKTGGGPMRFSTFDYHWRKLRARAVASGLPPCAFHDLRHLHATLGLSAGVDPKTISERLGHARVGFTLDTYAHVTGAMQQRAAERYEELLGDAGDDPAAT